MRRLFSRTLFMQIAGLLLLAAPAWAATHVVSAGPLNVRTGPGLSYRIVGTLAVGTRVTVSDTSGDWRKITHEGRGAWVHGDYLRRITTSTTTTIPTRTRPRSRAGLIQLVASGPGVYSYTTAGRRWGTPRMVYGIERIGRRWKARGMPRMGVGDISLQNGGYMSGHPYSHRTGKDADVRPVKDRGEGPVTIYQTAYNRDRTRALLGLYLAELPVQLIAFNDPRIYQPLAKVIYADGHHNHFHVRIP